MLHSLQLAAATMLGALCCACGGTDAKRSEAQVPTGPGDGVLFVGNSLTASNDLPGLVGSYLAALVIAGVLTEVSPRDMPARVVRPGGVELSVPAAVARVLQAAAADAIAPSADVVVFSSLLPGALRYAAGDP